MVTHEDSKDGSPNSPDGRHSVHSGNTSPAVLVLDDLEPACDVAIAEGGVSQMDSPFRLQGALEVGQPLDQWDYYSTTDNLEECGVDDEPSYVPDRGFRRYYPALRQLTPLRFGAKERKVLPVDGVGFFSFATFSWMTGFMWKLYRKGAFTFESYRCSFMESCNINSQRFEYLWGEEVRRRGPTAASVFRVSWRFMRTRVVLATIIYSFNLLGGLLTPIVFLPALINNAKQDEPSYLEGSFYAVAILAVDSTRALLQSLHGTVTLRTALRLRSALLTLIYRKVISLNSLGQADTGQILNLFSSDSQRLLEFGQVLHMWFPGLLTVIVSFVWLIWELQVSGATGVVAFIFFFLVQYTFAKMTAKYRTQAVSVTDGRVQKTREILSAIKVIKVNAWEDAFFKVISRVRLEELSVIRKIVFVQLMTGAVSNGLPALTTIITFMTCVSLGYRLTEAQSFAALGVLGWSRYGLVFLPVSFGAIAQARATMARIKEILLQADTRPCVSTPKDLNLAICLTNTTFGWDSPREKVNAKSKSGTAVKQSSTTPTKKKIASETKLGPADEVVSLSADLHPEAPKIVEVLFNMNLSVTKQQLVGICGPVGSGKSSLLSSILGQLHLMRGDLAFRGSFAYLPQQPWLMNATLRQNIVFADAFDSKRYYGAIHSCDLNDDLSSLAGGDQTEVGDSGATLSGGQKQRVALARAVYANRDIYLLDDPFSSLDSVVAEHVFQHCILGTLSPKTILLVTQKSSFLSQCDYVVVLRDGVIAEQGNPLELKGQGGYFASLLEKMAEEHKASETRSEHVDGVLKRKSVTAKTEANGTPSFETKVSAVNAGRLTRAEEKGSGKVSWETYVAYIRAMGGAGVALFVTVSVILFAAVVVLSGWWMSTVIRNQQLYVPQLTAATPSIELSPAAPPPAEMLPVAPNDSLLENGTISTMPKLASNLTLPSPEPLTDVNILMDDGTILLVFGSIVVTIIISAVFQAYLFSKATMMASARLHNSVLDKVFHGTMRFFEITPVGRILNIFTKDLDEVDCILSTMLNVCSVILWSSVFALFSVAAVFPWFLLSLPILGVLFMYTVLLFIVTSREVKRRENASRSPLFGHVNTTLNGLPSLHAFEKEKLFEREFIRLQDDNTALNFLMIGSYRWMGFRMDCIVAVCSSLVAFFIVFLHGKIVPSFAAMALIYCSMLSGLLNYTIRIISETMARFTNVERIIRYEQAMEWEGAKRNALPPAPHDWPSKGEVVFESVDLKYREGLPLALTGVSFRIPSGKKVAIVGRTGSGKSSLGVALFRLVEVQRGRIVIDDLDALRLPLNDLRSRLSIIPQDPFLFKGTVRYNLDPFNEHTDEEIWQALAKIRLLEKVAALENQLSYSVAESGDNFSVGEKQLMCLARAILRGSKVIFLDEALASVDTSTNAILHSSIMESFVDCTVLSVAHRLHRVMTYDYVLVMSNGQVAEYGNPTDLAEKQSLFSSLVAAEHKGDAGLSS